MEVLRKIVTLENFKTLLNLGGTGLVAVGICILPIDISFRLIILGFFALVMWFTLNR